MIHAVSYNGKEQLKSDGSKLIRLTTLAVCLTPILCIYRFMGYFMLGEIVLIGLFLANLLCSSRSHMLLSRKQIAVGMFAFMILLISCIGYLAHSVDLTVLPRLIRLLFCFFITSVLGVYFFDYQSAKKYMIRIAVVATILIIIQKVYHDLTGEYIYFLLKDNIYSEVYNAAYFKNVEIQRLYRPMSIFLEPSHYCQYILFVLAIILFRTKLSIKDMLLGAFLSIGIFVSTSSTGVIVCLVLWLAYLLSVVRAFFLERQINPRIIVVLLLIGTAAAFILVQFGDRFLFSIERIYNPNSSSSTSAWDARLGTFSVFSEHETWMELLFGRGYGVINEEEWYASIPYYFSGTGILGMIAIIVLFASLYCFSNKIQRKLLFVFLILCFTTEVLTNYWLIFILPLVMSATEDKGNDLI